MYIQAGQYNWLILNDLLEYEYSFLLLFGRVSSLIHWNTTLQKVRLIQVALMDSVIKESIKKLEDNNNQHYVHLFQKLNELERFLYRSFSVLHVITGTCIDIVHVVFTH